MAEYVPSECADDSFNCNNQLPLDQKLNSVFVRNEDGCLAILVTGISGGGGGGGDASAANQVTEIARLTSILGQLDITQTAAMNLLRGSGTKDLTTLSALFPTALGQNTMANSLAVTMASNQPIYTADNTLAPSSSRTVGVVNTAVAVKASAGNIYGWILYNKSGVDVWVKFCNVAAGSLVVGTTPVVLSLLVPTGTQPVIFNANAPVLGFSTAITMYATTGDTDANTTAPTAATVTANILYK